MDRVRSRRPYASLALVGVVVLVLAACDGESSDPFSVSVAPTTSTAPPVTVAPPSTSSSPTPPATPATPPPDAGVVATDCVGGWSSPAPSSRDYEGPIDRIRRAAPFAGPAQVVEMRLFVGPESPPSDKNYLQDIRRWYVKLYAPNDLAYQGRFLVEERRFGAGVVAVAPYDTVGFSSPDWIGFQWDAGDPRPRPYEGLPGRWRGVPYDFVRGGAGLKIPGLPDDVRGCLDGT
jgi:hypothetical protein